MISTLGILLVFAMGTAAIASTTNTNERSEVLQLMESKVSCRQLSDDQLEKIGDYIMEQMAPGAAYEQMEQMMGGEGSESLKQAHIFLARRWYCGDAAGYGMMGMMGNFIGYGSGWMMIFYILGTIFMVTGIAAFVKYLANKMK